MAEGKRLPLKVVPTLERDFYHPEPGGGPKKVFTKVTPEFRQKLSSEVIGVRDHFSEAFKRYPWNAVYTGIYTCINGQSSSSLPRMLSRRMSIVSGLAPWFVCRYRGVIMQRQRRALKPDLPSMIFRSIHRKFDLSNVLAKS